MGGDGWTPVVSDSIASEGALIGAPFTADDPRPDAKKFVDAFRAKFGVEPDGNAALGYDATITLAQAVTAAGSNREGIRAWLHTLDERTAIAGATGPIRFQPNGDPVGKGMVLTRARRGHLVPEAAR